MTAQEPAKAESIQEFIERTGCVPLPVSMVRRIEELVGPLSDHQTGASSVETE